MQRVLSEIWAERFWAQGSTHRRLQSHVRYSVAKSLEEADQGDGVRDRRTPRGRHQSSQDVPASCSNWKHGYKG